MERRLLLIDAILNLGFLRRAVYCMKLFVPNLNGTFTRYEKRDIRFVRSVPEADQSNLGSLGSEATQWLFQVEALNDFVGNT